MKTRRSIVAPLVVIVLVLSSCGSNLSPEQVAGAVGGDAVGAPASGLSGGPGTEGDEAIGAGGLDGSGTTTDGGSVPDGSGADGTDDSGGGGAPDGPDVGGAGEGGSGAPGTENDAPVVDPAKAGSCEGFSNSPGVTDSTITIGNSSDISGPVPGLFQTSRDATQAFVSFFNATSPDGICGRSLKLITYDSRADAAADQQAYVAACDEVFAMIGSMSAFDSGGAATAERCGLPDIRSANVTAQRNECGTCFGAQSTNTGEVANATADFILSEYGDAGQHAAFFYLNAGAAAENGPRQAAAMDKRGMNFDIVRGIEVAEFNYTPFVQELKDKDIEVVFFVGATPMSVRLRQTMQQQSYKPVVYMRDPTDYTRSYVETGGDAVDETIVFMNFTPFEEAGSNQEMRLYLSYLDQVRPGAEPGFFGVFSWSAARLFVEKAIALGGRLDRASLVASLQATTTWTGNNLHAPQHPGPHRTGDCFRFLQLDGETWKPVGGANYRCRGTTFG